LVDIDIQPPHVSVELGLKLRLPVYAVLKAVMVTVVLRRTLISTIRTVRFPEAKSAPCEIRGEKQAVSSLSVREDPARIAQQTFQAISAEEMASTYSIDSPVLLMKL
jgi:hypothetical protein